MSHAARQEASRNAVPQRIGEPSPALACSQDLLLVPEMEATWQSAGGLPESAAETEPWGNAVTDPQWLDFLK